MTRKVRCNITTLACLNMLYTFKLYLFIIGVFINNYSDNKVYVVMLSHADFVACFSYEDK